jgi:L-asparaginase II
VLLVETTRDGLVESAHHGAVVVTDAHGALRWCRGDPALRTFPRSALKPFQLLALVRRGGVQRFGFTPPEVAVMAASHSGEPIHVATVQSVLEKIEASLEALACGVHPPLDAVSAARLVQAGQSPTPLHNNCSGKHAGMLALARLLGAPLDGYLDPDHPAQCAIRDCLVDVLRLDSRYLPVGIDGCSAPAYAVPLNRMARGFALLGAAAEDAGLKVIGDAMRAHPELVGGTSGRADTELMRCPRGLVAKGGAEGYFCVGHPDGLGLALKILDGDSSGRARSVVAASVARRLGWIDAADVAGRLAEYASGRAITNWAGRRTGEVRLAAEFP